MQINGKFVLPPDLAIIPVGNLPAELAKRIGHDGDDVSLTRRRARNPTTIVDSETASLLRHFAKPTYLIDAVVLHSLSVQRQPHEVLQQVYPVVEELILCRLLVSEDEIQDSLQRPPLSPGDYFSEFLVLRAEQIVEDTEVYLVRCADGRFGALKRYRGNVDRDIRALFSAELNVLTHLDGPPAPRLFSSGEVAGDPYLVTEWITGASVLNASTEWRRNPSEISKLCLAVLDAYVALNARGVLHGDIHPRNVLVTQTGTIRLVDFGMSRLLSHAPSPDPRGPFRGGVAYFYDPEYALARLKGKIPPPVTARGEQYSVAALLWLIVSGVQYVDFSLKQDEFLRQIAEEQPEGTLSDLPSLENVLRRALSKDPAERFDSMASFSDAAAAALRASSPPPQVRRADPTIQSKVVEDVVERFGREGSALTTGLTEAPRASLSHGAAGISFALLRLAIAREDPELLTAADVWGSHAVRSLTSDEAFYNPEMQLEPAMIGDLTPFHTRTGVHLVAALTAAARGDEASVVREVANFCSVSDGTCPGYDLTLGWAGLLLGTSVLLGVVPDHVPIRQLGDRVFADLTGQLTPRLMTSGYLGIAHGLAGMTYAALRWSAETGMDIPASLADALEVLREAAEPWRRGMRWPISAGVGLSHHLPEYMTGWCHGPAGYAHLWALAETMVPNHGFEQLAEAAAWATWEEPSASGTLCCGMAGQAYALLRVGRLTHDDRWIPRARQLAFNASLAPVEYDTSLWKGKLGIAVLLAELSNAEYARMPLFEPESWAQGKG